MVVPVEDLGELGGSPVADGSEGAERPSIWPHVEERIADLVQSHRSTIVFANSRRLAERLCNRLNEIAYERATGEPLDQHHAPAELMGGSGAAQGAPPVIARAHHGSVSKEQRALVEEDLKAGRLPAVVATSSLELGIDMGAVDLVIQVESPLPWPPVCSEWAARVTRWARSPPAWSSRSTEATWSRQRSSRNACAPAPSSPSRFPRTPWTCSPSRSSR